MLLNTWGSVNTWVAEDVARRPLFGPGAPFASRKKPKSFHNLLSFKGDLEIFEVEVEPIEVKEVSTSIQREIDRFEGTVEILQQQEAQAENEIELLKDKVDEIEKNLKKLV